MTLRIGASGLLFILLSLSGCPKPSEQSRDAGEDLPVVIETRAFSAGPHGNGQFLEPDQAPSYTSMKLFVGGDPNQVIDGTYANGRITFEHVPTVDNVIELRLPHSTLTDVVRVVTREAHHRLLYSEHQQWGRPDSTLTDAGTTVSFDATGLVPWSLGNDYFYLYSGNAQLARYWYPDPTLPPPDDGDTTVTDFGANTVDMYADDFRVLPPLVDASKGDSLTVLQRREAYTSELDGVQLARWDPWAQVYPLQTLASMQLTGVQFTAGGTAHLTAALTPLTVTKAMLDLRSDTFAAAREELDMPANARMASNNSVYFEPGSGDTLYLAPTPTLWTHNSRSSTLTPANPECYPDFNGDCDAGCGGTCDHTLTDTYTAPRNVMMPVELTHPITDPGTEMLYTAWRIGTSVTTLDGGTLSISAWNTITRPMPSSSPVVVERTLSAPRSLLVDGAPLPPSSTSVSTLTNATPTFSWTAPAMGTPKRYEVQVVDYRIQTPTFTQTYPVALFTTTRTSVNVPAGVLLPGHLYIMRVSAIDDPNDVDDARIFARNGTYVRAEAVTGAFTLQ